jgi:hypothetical protein
MSMPSTDAGRVCDRKMEQSSLHSARGNQESIEKFTRINVYHAENFAYFLGGHRGRP